MWRHCVQHIHIALPTVSLCCNTAVVVCMWAHYLLMMLASHASCLSFSVGCLLIIVGRYVSVVQPLCSSVRALVILLLIHALTQLHFTSSLFMLFLYCSCVCVARECDRETSLCCEQLSLRYSQNLCAMSKLRKIAMLFSFAFYSTHFIRHMHTR